MSNQPNRSGKNNGIVNYSLLSSFHSGSGGQRRSSLKNSKTTPLEDPLALDRLADLLANASGKAVVATVSSGARYQGLLVTAGISTGGNSPLSIVLAKPTLLSHSLINEKSNVDEKLPEKLVIQSKDLIDVAVNWLGPSRDIKEHNKSEKRDKAKKGERIEKAEKAEKAESRTETLQKPNQLEAVCAPKAISYSEIAKGLSADKTNGNSEEDKSRNIVNFASESIPNVLSVSTTEPKLESKFKTDRDISAGYKFKEREFEKWTPEEGWTELTLDDSTFSSGTWDQFKVNQEKFGVESTYDEHLYTTRVNTTALDYQKRLHRAQKIAREIEGLLSLDHHVLEERGISAVNDSGMDEEDKYSGVLADAPAKVDTRGSELMAALRIGSSSGLEPRTEQKLHIPGNGKYATPGQRAAHYHNDPAIVSSSAAKKHAQKEAAGAITKPTETKQAAERLIAQTAKEDSATGAGNGQGGNKDTTKAVKVNEGASEPTSQQNRKGNADATKDSFRLNAQSEINSLKEFSASFKVPHKIPNDLISILAKDKNKQDEILKKKDPAKPKNKEKETKFKLNPRATAFTPSRPMHASPLQANKPISSPRIAQKSSIKETKPHLMSAVEFYGSQEKIPTAESQEKKLERFRRGFNMFATAIREAEAGESEENDGKRKSVVFAKSFMTPPTWDSTVDESYEKVLTDQALKTSAIPGQPGMPFMGNTMIAPGAFGGVGGNKYPASPSMQQSMAFQQQQMQAAIFYQQMQAAIFYQQMQAGAAGRPGPHMMYMPPGFVVPGMMTHGHLGPNYSGNGAYGKALPDRSSSYSDRGHSSHSNHSHREYPGAYNNRRYYNQKRTYNN